MNTALPPLSSKKKTNFQLKERIEKGINFSIYPDSYTNYMTFHKLTIIFTAKLVITVDEVPLHNGHKLTLKKNLDYALKTETNVKNVLVAKFSESSDVQLQQERDDWLEAV